MYVCVCLASTPQCNWASSHNQAITRNESENESGREKKLSGGDELRLAT